MVKDETKEKNQRQNQEELGCFPGGQGFWRKDGQLISHGKKKLRKNKMDRRLSSSIQMRKDEGMN